MKKLFYLIIFLVISCSKSDEYVDRWGVHHAGNPNIKWRFVFPDTLTYGGDIAPVIYKDKVFFTFGRIVYALDKRSGNLLGKWVGNYGTAFSVKRLYVWKNLLILNGAARTTEKIFAINMDTNQLAWELPFYVDYDEFAGVEDKLFFIRDSKLVVLNISSMKVEKSIPLSLQTGIFSFNSFPEFYLNSKKESCFLTMFYENNEKRLLNYNLTLDTVIYNQYLTEQKGNNTTNFCKIEGDNVVYSEGNGSVRSNNLTTGAYSWIHNINTIGNTTSGRPAFGEKSVFVSTSSNEYLVRLNLSEGKEIWKIKKERNIFGFSSNEQFYYHRNMIYWSGGGSGYAFRADNGSPVWQNWAAPRNLAIHHNFIFEDNNIFVGASNDNWKGGHSAICIETPN